MVSVNKHRSHIGIALLVISLVYLLVEIVFNTMLVSIVGNPSSTGAEIQRVELFGRAASGIGVSLLLLSSLSSKIYYNPAKFLLVGSLIVLITWPLVFFGQKLAVDNWVVKSSNAEQRQRATISLLLKDALANNSINIVGVDFNHNELESASNRTFLTLFGGLLYADQNMQQTLDAQIREIIPRYVKSKAYRDFELHYLEYTKLFDDISGLYGTYLEGSQRYNSAINHIEKDQSKAVHELEKQIDNSYAKYKSAVEVFEKKAKSLAETFGPRIYQHFEKVEKCNKRSDKISCIDKQNSLYRTGILKAGLGYIKPEYFLREEAVSTKQNVMNSLIGGLATGGVSFLAQAFDVATGGKGGFVDSKLVSTQDINFYKDKFAAQMSARFLGETGYVVSIKDRNDFQQQTKTRNDARKALNDKGLNLPANWKITDKSSLLKSVEAKVIADAENGWLINSSKYKLKMRPNFDWLTFQQHESVQLKLAEAVGEFYFQGMRVDLNKRQFQLQVLDRAVKRESENLLKQYEASEELFENGNQLEIKGKDSLKAVLVPPLSMAISLALICLTLASLPAKVFGVFFSGKRPVWPYVVTISMTVIFITTPFIFQDKLYANKENSTVGYFFTKIDQNVNPIYGNLLRWAMATQPLIIPMGERINKNTGLYTGFEHIERPLIQMDANFMNSIFYSI